MARASGQAQGTVHAGQVTGSKSTWEKVGGWLSNWLEKVFKFNSAGLHWGRGVMILDVMLVPLVVFWSIGYEEYLLSAIFGVLFTAVVDPGGRFGRQAAHAAVFGAVGAGLTALGFDLGGDAWGWLVLAAFAVTLAAGLVIMFGPHRAVEGLLLNIWFLIALGTAFSYHQTKLYHHTHQTGYTWAQALAFAGGSAVWIAMTLIAWLIRRRRDAGQVVEEFPSDISRVPLTRPVIMFSVLRAVVIAGTVALAFGVPLSHGLWMPIAAIIAMKPDLGQSTLLAIQRLVGAALGAGVAALLLLIPANVTGLQLVTITHGLTVVALVIFMHAAATRFWNFTVFTAAISAGVLILLDLPQPSNYGAEGYRILWTLYGVGIGVIVILLATLLTRQRSARSQ